MKKIYHTKNIRTLSKLLLSRCICRYILTLLLIFALIIQLKAQIILEQDFQNGSLAPWESVSTRGSIKEWIYVSTDPDYYGRHAHFAGGKEDNEDWLVSQEVALPATSNDLKLTFDLIHRYGTDNANTLQLLLSENYTGSVTEADWVELTYQMPEPAPSWQTPYYSSGDIDLTPYVGKNIHIALKAETHLTGGNYNNATRNYRVDNFIIRQGDYQIEGNNLPLEDAVSSNWSSSQSSILSVSDAHYKKGNRSIEWAFNSGDTLFISQPDLDPDKVTDFYHHTFKLWVYNTVPAESEGLIFQFLDANGTIQYSFNFGLNYTGWRKILRSYRYDMQGAKTTSHLDQLRIIAPSSVTNGRIFFDDLSYVKKRELRYRDFQMPDIDGYLSDTENYDAYQHSYEGAAEVPTAIQLEEINKIKQSYLQTLKGNAPTASAVDNAKNFYSSLNIVEGPDGIRGKPVDETNIGIFEAPMLTLARNFIHSGDMESKEMMILMTRHLLDQGVAFGSNIIVAGGSKGYSFRKTPDAIILMHDQLPAELKEQLLKMFIWQFKLNDFWNQNRLPGGNMDDIHVMGSRVLGSILFFMEDEGLKNQYLIGFKEYLENILTESPGTRGGIKPDGVSFHHNAHYNGYMYAYNTLGNFLYYLKETSFQIDQQAYSEFKKAIMTMALMSVKSTDGLQYFNFLAGRHPFYGVNFPIQKQTVYKIAKLGGDLDGRNFDPEIAELYNRVWGDIEEFQNLPVESPNGFWSFNFSPMSLYRQDNWAVGIKGMNNVFWGSEIYSAKNRYGRYLSYGAVEVLYEGGNEQSGYDINGWDWNKIPGTTTINLPWNKLIAETSRIDEKSASNFAGAVKFNSDTGFYAFDFKENNNEGRFANHNPSFRFQKSMYSINGKIISLGSGIENNDQINPTITTIFQNSIHADSPPVTLNSSNLQGNREINGETVNWFLDAYGTGYIIMPGDNILFTQGLQESPGETGDGSFTTGEFATGWIDHGTGPDNAAYEMIIVPNSSEAEMSELSSELQENKLYNILKMDKSGHIVKFGDNITAYSLFSSNILLDGNIIEANDKPCMIMAENTGEKLKIKFINPNTSQISNSSHYGLQTVTLTLSGNWDIDSGNGVRIERWDENKTQINVTSHYGQQIEFILNKVDIVNGILKDKNVPSEFVLYPNPNEDLIFIHLYNQQQKPKTIIIRDLMGNELFNETYSRYDGKGLDISFLPRGIYLFSLAYDEKIDTTRIIKK